MKTSPLPMEVAELLPLLEMLDQGVALHSEDGGVLACNAAIHTLLGFRHAELPGSASVFMSRAAFEEDGSPLHPENEPARQLLSRGVPAPARELRVSLPDGSSAWLLCRAAPLPPRTPGGAPRAVTLLTDRTEQHALRQEALASQSMATLGRLSAQLAHDIRNLLTVILGNDEVLLEDLHPSSPGWHEAIEIRGAAEQGGRFIAQLLTLAAGGTPEVENVNLNQLLAGMEPMLARLLGAGIEIRVRTSPGLAAVRASRTGIEQVVLNLALNARDAMGAFGRLTISVSNVVIGPELAQALPGYAAAGRYVSVKVQDDGPGMDETTRARAFEPFFTTRGRDRGFGLGLSIVRNVVERCGGHVDLATEPGRGTTFTVYLPCEDDVPAAGADSQIAEREAG